MNKKTLVHACNFCDRPATKDVLGELEIFEHKIAKIYLCDQCGILHVIHLSLL